MSWKYLARIRPHYVKAGEPITISIDAGKLQMRGANVTLELYELDTYIKFDREKKRWRAYDGENPLTKITNKDDRLVSWKGTIKLGTVDDEPRWHFRPDGDAYLRDKTLQRSRDPSEPPGHVLGAALTVRFEGFKNVYYIPLPYTEERYGEARGGEGDELELGVVLKEGEEVIYSSDEAVTYVRDWRWWAASSYAPARAGNSVDFYNDGHRCFIAMRDGILRATKYIYLTDWQLFPYVCLDRTAPVPEPAYPKTKLGPAQRAKPSPLWDKNTVFELLVAAVSRGVDVRVLLWKSPGVEQDNLDDTTFVYLMAHGVKCAFHNPIGDKNELTRLYWSHHQKTIVVDDEIAFVGGLDLAHTRWDTPDHAPFDERSDPRSGHLSRHDKDKKWFNNAGFHEGDFVKQADKLFVDLRKHPFSDRTNHPLRTDRAPLLRERNPRSGWHDVHCAVRGPAAIDVKRNFVQRWQKSIETTKADVGKAGRKLDGWFLKRDLEPTDWGKGSIAAILPAAGLAIAGLFKDPGTARERIERTIRYAEDCRHYPAVEWWKDLLASPAKWSKLVSEIQHKSQAVLEPITLANMSKPPERGGLVVQMVRSISNDSIYPNTAHQDEHDKYAEYRKLLRQRGDGPEMSIYAAYYRGITCAQHFVYIESQMFISAGFPGAPGNVENRVAGWLYKKIKQKIKQKRPFHVYVVLPEIYDSDPFKDSSREIQKWQWQTLTRLEKAIGDAAKEVGKKAKDYFSVYALRALGVTTDGQALHRSNQVYVHSKLMIVDDRFVTLGSANLNDRSLTGYRDSELNAAILGDPDTTATMGRRPWKVNKTVRDFRVTLFKEHLGSHYGNRGDVDLRNASCESSVKHIQAAAEANWEAFDELYSLEMLFLEAEAAYLGEEDPVKAGNTARDRDIYRTQLAMKSATLQGKGHLITHPFRSRPESKGDDTIGLVPDKITT